MQEIPKHFRAQFTDRFINFVRSTGEMMIQMELEFNSCLDIARLKKALDLTLDAEPILGCRLVKRWWRPHWERLDADSRDVLLVAEDAREYEGFKRSPIDPYTGPQIKACLLRTTDRNRLLIKVAHEVADARAVTQIAKIVSTNYSRLAYEPEYRPEPNINGDRSIWQVLSHVPWHAYPTILYNYYSVYMLPLFIPLGTVHLPVTADNDRTLEFINRTVPEGLLKCIIEYGRQRNGTLNDIMMAALFHAITKASDWDHKSQLRLRVTVDLRRFKPADIVGGICNLGGMEIVDLGTDLNDDFDYTLRRISSFMRQRKAYWIGLHDYLGFAPLTVFHSHNVMTKIIVLIVETSTNAGHAPTVFTNMGAIEQTDVTFDVPPVEARLLPPVDYPPHIIFCFSSYNRSLTISAGSWPCSKKLIERCLDEMIAVLSGLSSEKAAVTAYAA
ncbi:MAG: hypothetical protein WC562_08660 [Dehalococcoidia bacterium]